MTDWKAQRKAAAWYLRESRRLLWADLEFSGEISRHDNKQVFNAAMRLRTIGRNIAMGYELDDWTQPIYWAHLKATRPKREYDWRSIEDLKSAERGWYWVCTDRCVRSVSGGCMTWWPGLGQSELWEDEGNFEWFWPEPNVTPHPPAAEESTP